MVRSLVNTYRNQPWQRPQQRRTRSEKLNSLYTHESGSLLIYSMERTIQYIISELNWLKFCRILKGRCV
jgi:hypothetical protein